MSLSIVEIAKHLEGKIEGDNSLYLTGLSEINQAQTNQLCFAESEKYLPELQVSSASAVIVSKQFPAIEHMTLIRVDNPRLGFIRAMELYSPDRTFSGIHQSAVVAVSVQMGINVGIGPNVVIGEGAVLGSNVSINAGAYIGANVSIGDGCSIGSNVSVLHGCKIGDRCILHPGVCIGSDGYGFRWLDDHHHKIPQLGTVVIEDDVEIGANSCIDRATMTETWVGAGTKIDNLVHIAHNNRIGKHVLMTALVGIAGSSKIGDGVVLAGQAGVIDHVELKKGVQVGAKSLVTKDINENAKIWGIPARPIHQTKKLLASMVKLPVLIQQLKSSRNEIETLKKRLDEIEKKQ